MALQVRMVDPATGQEFHFSPMRDISVFLPQIIKDAAVGLEEAHWEPFYADYLKANNITEQVLLETLLSYYKFCTLATKTKLDTPAKALEESGFFSAPLPAQLVVLAKLTQRLSGAFWAGVRNASRMNENPIEIEELKDHAAELEQYIKQKWDQIDEPKTTSQNTSN
jgi:hypothetical protein